MSKVILLLILISSNLIFAHTLFASEPTVGFNGWTNIPGVVEGFVTSRPIDSTVPAPPLGYLEYLPKGYNQNDTATRWPLVVFIAGEGEVGDGTDTVANGNQLSVLMEHHGPFHLIATGHWDFPAVVVAVQSPGPWNNATILLSVITYMQSRYNIDNSHLYLTGVSGAADGVLNFAASHPNFLTAISPMSCGLHPSATAAAAIKDTPMWVEHDYNDPTNARTASISWVDQVTQSDIGTSNVMSTYPGYAGTSNHEALQVSSTSALPANRAGPTTVITNCTLTHGDTWIAFGSPNNFGSATFNTWGGTDAQPYASVNLGATTPDTTPSNNIIALGKGNGVYLTQPYAGASATQSITIQIPVGIDQTAFDDISPGTWSWEPGLVWDQAKSSKRIFTMPYYLDHQKGWVLLYGTGDFWNWMFTQSQTIAPAITSPTAYTVYAGYPCIFSIAATNSPTIFGASPLPAGLQLDTTTGAITGTPTGTGVISAVLSAGNTKGTGYAPLIFTVLPGPPMVTSATTSSTVIGNAYSYSIAATNSPSSFTASPLPRGLSVSATSGIISGIPSALGTTMIMLTATNSTGTGAATLNLTVTAATPSTTTTGMGTSANGTTTAAGYTTGGSGHHCGLGAALGALLALTLSLRRKTRRS